MGIITATTSKLITDGATKPGTISISTPSADTFVTYLPITELNTSNLSTISYLLEYDGFGKPPSKMNHSNSAPVASFIPKIHLTFCGANRIHHMPPAQLQCDRTSSIMMYILYGTYLLTVFATSLLLTHCFHRPPNNSRPTSAISFPTLYCTNTRSAGLTPPKVISPSTGA